MTTRGIRKGWGWPLLVALILSSIGDEISLIALMFRTADAPARFAVPMLLVAQLLPGLLAAPFIGRLVDARDAGVLLIGTALANAGILAAIAWHPDLVATLAGAALLSLSFAIGGTAAFALIPVLATGLGMTVSRANAVLEGVRSVGMLTGPVAGAALVAWGGTRSALLIDAASFAVLAGVVLASSLRRPVEADADAEAVGLIDAYRGLLHDSRIMTMVGAFTLEVYATAIADVAFVFLVTVTLGAGPAAFGLLTATWAGGMIAGAALAGRIPIPRPAPIAFAAAAVMGATMLAIGIGSTTALAGPPLVAIAFLLGGGANSVHNVAVRTMLQTEAPAAAQGRVAALYTAATSSAAVAGYVTGGFFTPDRAALAYTLGGTLGIVAGEAGWLLFRRTRPAE